MPRYKVHRFLCYCIPLPNLGHIELLLSWEGYRYCRLLKCPFIILIEGKLILGLPVHIHVYFCQQTACNDLSKVWGFSPVVPDP